MDNSDETKPITTVHRKASNSGLVDYADEVVLHQTSKTKVTAIPWFVSRTAGTELSVKIATEKRGEGEFDWILSEDKSITLNDTATRKLLTALEGFISVAKKEKKGQFLTIHLDDGHLDMNDGDPSLTVEAIFRVLSKKELRPHLDSCDISNELTYALRTNIRLKEMFLAVEQLRDHLNSCENDEKTYQKWCERHTWAFGNAYVMKADDVRRISTGDTVDLLLPTVASGYRDIVELKRPDMEVLGYDASHRNHFFSREVSQAIGQCHRYLDILHEMASNGLLDHREVVAYHPRATIVIGRSHDWDAEKHKALHGLNRRLSGVVIMTYDHLLAQGEHLLEVLKGDQTEETEL